MKFGIELEFTAAVAHANRRNHVGFYDCVLDLMRESAVYQWRFENDASCGNEIVSPILSGSDGLHQALQACHCAKVAQKKFNLGAIEGRDAGVHFHFDANDLIKQSKTKNPNVVAIRNVLLLSAILEPLWFSMNPGARFETAFAAPLNFNLYQLVRARDMVDLRDVWFRHYQGVLGHADSYRIQRQSYAPNFINNDTQKPDKYDWTRYHGMNLNALWKHGTFEFRYTHGSFDPENVESWFHFYKRVVELARSTNTKSIVRACPINIEDIKSNSITGLHDSLYYNLNLAINFMFRSPTKGSAPLFAQDPKLLKFILTKIIKYNYECVPPNVAKKIWFDDGTNFERLMSYIQDIRIQSLHYRRNRYQWTPRVEAVSTNSGLDYPEDNYNDTDEEPY